MLSPYPVPAIRIGPDVRTFVTTVAAVTAIEAGNDHLRGVDPEGLFIAPIVV
jgi:hypothetical protein